MYGRWHPKHSAKCKYTSNNKHNFKNYVMVESKGQGILAMLVLDFLGNHPTFVSENLKLGETHDIPF